MKNFAFIIVIQNIKNPNLILSGGIKNKYKGAYNKIFDILNEDFVFVEFGSEDEELIGNDFYLYFNLTPDLEKLHRITKIPNVKIISQTYSQGGLIAPNGKPSNLNATQYELVRTTEFKNWFGDWEKDPENSSKVVDGNGEPQVCYHGTNSGKINWETGKFDKFNIFRLEDKIGAWFTPNKQIAKNMFMENQKTIYVVFLNIKKPYLIKADKSGKDSAEILYQDVLNDYNSRDAETMLKKELQLKKYDGIVLDKTIRDVLYGKKPEDQIIAFEPNQIKNADGTNTTFDSGNDDIRFEKGGTTESGTPNYLRMFLGK
jgi:hypothetical protein